MNENTVFETSAVRRTLEFVAKRNVEGGFFVEFGANLALAIPKEKTTNFHNLVAYLDSVEDRFKNNPEVWVKFCRLYLSIVKHKRQWESYTCNHT